MNASRSTPLRALSLSAWLALTVGAQQPDHGAQPLGLLRSQNITADSPTEYTLLLLNLLSTSAIPTAIHPFSGPERASLLSAAAAASSAVDVCPSHSFEWSLPLVSAWINTNRGRQDRDGAVWQGRGLTAALTGGFVFERRFLSAAVRPIAFGTQNLAYTPLAGAGPAPADFSFPDPAISPYIDLPYRFGARPYGRIEPGESWIRVGAPFLSGGFTTASQHWGPAVIYPLVMGTEGAGYPRVFIETSVPLGIGRAKANWSVGRLESSGFTQLAPGERSRIAPALVGTFEPAGFPGLEVGAARMFHQRWSRTAATLSTAMEPFSVLYKTQAGELAAETNQMASIFARLAPPGGGVEVYGELYREDHSANFRDLVGEPDHASAYSVGLRRAWLVEGGVIRAFTLEGANGRISHIQRVRDQAPVYIHTALTEGHTFLGQPLGSSAAIGGGGVTAIVEQIEAQRSYSAEASLRRSVQRYEGGTWNGRLSGFYGLSLSRKEIDKNRTGSWSIGADYGFGFERGVNLTLERSFRWD